VICGVLWCMRLLDLLLEGKEQLECTSVATFSTFLDVSSVTHTHGMRLGLIDIPTSRGMYQKRQAIAMDVFLPQRRPPGPCSQVFHHECFFFCSPSSGEGGGRKLVRPKRSRMARSAILDSQRRRSVEQAPARELNMDKISWPFPLGVCFYTIPLL